MLPVASLAAILVYTGGKLVNPGVVRQLRRYGKSEVLIYVVTIVAIVVTDLLTGVVIGLLVAAGKLALAASRLRIVLEDEKLRASWKAELDGMRNRIQTLRKELAAALNRQSNSQAFDFIVRQSGMFSRLPLTEGQAQRLKDEHAVYVVPDGRINIAGLNPQNTAVFAKAYAETR